MPVENFFGLGLLLFSRRFNCLIQSGRGFLGQLFLLCFEAGFQGILRVELLGQQLVVLLVVLLHVGRKLLRVGFLKSVDGLIVRLELCQLFFVFLHAPVESTFEFFNLTSEVGNLGLVVLIELLLLRQQSFLILLELLKAFLLLFDVLLLELPYFRLPGVTFLRVR